MTDNLRCNYCNKVFKYESEKKRHELSHSPRFKCGVCNKKFSFNSALRRHEKQHQRTEKVQCKQCSRSFRDEALLKRHVKYAHKGKYTCLKCYAEFHSELALGIHEKTHNAKSERKYKCSHDGCEKTFNFPHHLKHHEMTHTNTKQYYCDICKKGFIQFHHFKSHMRTHELEKWLPCPEVNCKKSFPTESYKKRHLLRVHNIKLTDISPAEPENNKSEFECDIKKDTTVVETRDDLPKCSLAPNENTTDLPNDKVQIDEGIQSTYDDNPIHDCKSALGDCIVDGNSTENCLCEQMRTTVKDYYNSTLIPDENMNSANTQSNLVKTDTSKRLKIKNVGSQSCACSCNIQSDLNTDNGICNLSTGQRNTANRNCGLKNSLANILPDIEYKLDGSIKLKSTFDDDIKVFESVKVDYKEKKGVEIYNSNYVPFNSCKAVLGKCIVSGNGTISEECLCAKMLVDEQQVTAEEIDEITPHPANTAYLSVI